jgi:hypothetical protein
LESTLSSERRIEIHVDKKSNVNYIIREFGDEFVAYLLAFWLKDAIYSCSVIKIIMQNRVNKRVIEEFNAQTHMSELEFINYIVTGTNNIQYKSELPFPVGTEIDIIGKYKYNNIKGMNLEKNEFNKIIIKYQIVLKLSAFARRLAEQEVTYLGLIIQKHLC